ncbi:MAG: hypothetical protein COB76_04150 [Alphaproteobacteria bacterium]|nr:MAG: hypothetical protein COB76_04150 [Alphaproteobacteria bacterium]
MKAILKNNLDLIQGRLKTIPFPPFITPLHLRRASMGAATGIVLTFLLTLFIGSSPTSYETFDMDSEILPLTDIFPKQEVIDPSLAFGHFVTNKSPLSDEQTKAINTDTPRLTLVVTDLGHKKSILKSIMEKLPTATTLSLSSYTPIFNAISAPLKNHGFEIWLTLQTNTSEKNVDNGSAALTPINDFETNAPLMEAQIKGKAHVTGLMLSERSLLTHSQLLWGEISTDLFAEGYGVFDTTQKPLPSPFFYYDKKPAPYITGDITLDTNISAVQMKARLSEIKDRIMTEKNLVLSLSIYTPSTLDILVEWVNSLQSDGVTLIPLSAQAKL